MSVPLVQILIPTYEPRAEHLRAALDSLIAQTEKRWTAFIHDDASSTNVEEIVKPYLSDPRFRFERSSMRRGIGGNWNACLRKIENGKLKMENESIRYFQFLFQDDLWHPDYLRHGVELLEENPAIGFVVSNHNYRFDDGTLPPIYEEIDEKRSAIPPGGHNGREFLHAWMREGLRPNIIGEPSFVMVRRSLMEQAGPFHEKLVQGLDVEFWIRLLAKSDFAFIPEKLGTFRVHAAGASARHEQSGMGLYDRLTCFETLLNVLPARLDKKEAQRILVQQLVGMIGKFFERKKKGNAVGTQGSGSIFGFCARHPWMTSLALIQHVLR